MQTDTPASTEALRRLLDLRKHPAPLHEVSPSQLAVCGRDIPITSVNVDHLTSSDFLAKYNFTPNLIGLSDADILDISLNKLHSTKACGEFADPGTHLLISNGDAIVEVGNDYFHLTK